MKKSHRSPPLNALCLALIGFALAATPGLPVPAAETGHPDGSIRVCWTANNLDAAVPAQPVHESASQADGGKAPAAGSIVIDSSERHQTMAGVGAAFSEIGALAFVGLPKDRQEELLKSLFDVPEQRRVFHVPATGRFERFRGQRLFLRGNA